MESYWFISLFIALLGIMEICLGEQKRTKWLRGYIFFVAVFVLFVFGGIRQMGSGIDDYQYHDFFNTFVIKLSEKGFLATIKDFRYESLIYVIALTVSFFTKNSQYFIFVYCAITVCVNASYFRKLTPLPVIALAIYSAHLFINKDVNQIRFGMSSAFFLGFLFYLSQKKVFRCATLFLLSFISHATAITALLLPLALLFKKNKYIPICIILCSIPLAFMGSKSLIVFLSAHLGDIGDRAMGYAPKESVQEQGVLTLSNIKNIVFVGIYCFFLLGNERRVGEPRKFNFYYLLVLTFSLGSALRLALQDYATGGRLANYLLHIEPVLLSLCLYEIRKKLKPAGILLVLLIIIYYLTYNTVLNKQSITGYGVSETFMIFRTN